MTDNAKTNTNNTDAAAAETGESDRKGFMARVRSSSFRRGGSSSRSRSRSSSRSRDGRPSYRFLMTVQRISGLPSNWTTMELQHPADDSPMKVQLSDGVAHIHRGIAFERAFRKSVDREADAKFRLVGENGKKFGKIHLDLEQLRQEIDMRDNIIAKIVTFEDDMDLGGIKMEFKLGYFAIDTQTSSSTPAPITSTDPVVFDEVSVTTPVGPLGASFANTLIPPTIIRLVPLPDGRESPLKGKVTARSELIKFNELDATLWTLDDFKDHLIASKDDKQRTLVFQVPRLSAENTDVIAPVDAPVAEDGGAKDEKEDTDKKDNVEGEEKEKDGSKGVGTAAAVAAVGGALTAVVVTAGGDDDAEGGEAASGDDAVAEKEDSKTDNDQADSTVEAEVNVMKQEVFSEPAKSDAQAEAGGGDERALTSPAAKEEASADVWDKGYLDNVGFEKNKAEADTDDAAKAEEEKPKDAGEGAGPSFEVSVPHFVINAKHQYVLYDIVTQGLMPGDNSKCRVLRRYNNFVELKAALEAELDGTMLPNLPSKWTWNAIFKRFDEELVEDRRLTLEMWLKTVYDTCTRTLKHQDTLTNFLTVAPTETEVLDFESKDPVQVNVKEDGQVRLYGKNFDEKTPREPRQHSGMEDI